MEEKEIKIDDLFKVLIKRWKLIFGFAFIATLFAGIMSYYYIKPMYSSSTKFFVGKEISNSENTTVHYSSNDIEMYQKLLNTYAELIKTSDLIENALKENNLNISVGQVLSGLKAIPKADTQIMGISFQGSDPKLCKEVLDAVTNEFIKESEELIPNGNVKIIEKARVHPNPISPNKSKNIVVGFLAGVILGILTAFCLEYINNTVESSEQLQDILGIPVLGKIPVEE